MTIAVDLGRKATKQKKNKKKHPCLTERLLMGLKELNQTNKSGLLVAFYSICCLGVSTIFESEKDCNNVTYK